MTDLPSENQLFTITLLRHGESTGNLQGLYQGQADFPLSETGIAQVTALAKRWQDTQTGFDQIISSPLQRAAQTATIIGKELQIPITEDPLWMERDIGLLAGGKWKDIERSNFQASQTQLFEPLGETGESHWQLYLRAGMALQDLFNRPPGKYLVVSHGGILNMVLHAALGIAPQAGYRGVRFRFHNTAYAVLQYQVEYNTMVVVRLNERSHWEGK